jgi:hypothetical protein
MAALSALAACSALPAHAAESHEGVAYSADGKTLLYRESHWIDGDRRVVLYRCPNGEAFARKVMERNRSHSPDFELLDARDGYRGGVRTTPGGREVFLQVSAAAPVERRRLGVEAPVVDAGFDQYVRAHWHELAQQPALRVSFVLPDRLAALDFKVRRLRESATERVLRLSLGAWYGAALPHVDVAYAIAGRTLLRYRGVGNIRDDDGRHQAVDIRFPPLLRRQVPASELTRAAASRLVSRCS